MIKIKEEDRKYLFGGILSLFLMLLYCVGLSIIVKRDFVDTFYYSYIFYYILIGFFSINIFFAIKSKYFFRIYVVSIFIYFFFMTFADNAYSPIDECIHFDNINYIISNHALYIMDNNIDTNFLNEANEYLNCIPTTPSYEAVQAPLFYIVFAIIGAGISSAYIRLHLFRVISLLCVGIIIYLINKCIKLLREIKIINISDEFYRGILLLTVLSFGYLHRASRINNEILVCILVAIITFLVLQSLLRGYSSKDYWIISLLCVCTLLTKSTSIYVYFIFLFLVIYQKKIKEAIIPVGVCGCLVIPWFIFNLKTYGALTAMKEHLDFVLPIVNEKMCSVDIINAISSFFITFFAADELEFNSADKFIINLSGVFIIYLLVKYTKNLIVRIKKDSLYKLDKKDSIGILCMVGIIALFVVMCLGTFSTKINSIRGRYFYSILPIVIIFFSLNYEEFKTRNYIKYIIIITTAIASTRGCVEQIGNVFYNNNIYSSKVSQLELADITNDSWNNGVSIDGYNLLLPVDYRNYDLLKGREIILEGNQKRYIKDVVQKDDFYWVTLNEGIDSSIITTNIAQLGKKYKSCCYCNYEELDNILCDKTTEICQEVINLKSKPIKGFGLLFHIYCQDNIEINMSYKICDSNNNVILESEKKICNLTDNEIYDIFFDSEVDIKKGEKFKIYFILNESNGKVFSLGTSDTDKIRDCKLYVNNNEIIDKDLILQIWQ